MRSRNLILLLAGVSVALVTLFVSWRFGVVFFLLPLFFVWSWGGDGGRRAARGDGMPRAGRDDEDAGDALPDRGDQRDQYGDGGDDREPGGDEREAEERGGDDGPAMGEDEPGPRPATGSGRDGEGI